MRILSYIIIVLFSNLYFILPLFAETVESENYSIEQSSLSTGGSQTQGTSESYEMTAVLGAHTAGESESESFSGQTGYAPATPSSEEQTETDEEDTASPSGSSGSSYTPGSYFDPSIPQAAQVPVALDPSVSEGLSWEETEDEEASSSTGGDTWQSGIPEKMSFLLPDILPQLQIYIYLVAFILSLVVLAILLVRRLKKPRK